MSKPNERIGQVPEAATAPWELCDCGPEGARTIEDLCDQCHSDLQEWHEKAFPRVSADDLDALVAEDKARYPVIPEDEEGREDAEMSELTMENAASSGPPSSRRTSGEESPVPEDTR